MNDFWDYAAAAPARKDFLNFWLQSAEGEGCVNPEAGNGLAHRMRKRLQEAELRLSKALTGHEKNLIHWLHSGTEALAACAELLAEVLPVNACVITTAAEHPALLMNLFRTLGKERVLYVPLTRDGGLDLEKLPSLCAEKNIGALFIHHVNSETGRVQDFQTLRRVLDSINPKILLLADTVQSAGKMDLSTLPLSLLIVSGHKWGTPPCAAILYRPAVWHSFFESFRKNYRCGRPDVPSALTLAFAAEQLTAEMTIQAEKTARIHCFLRMEIAKLCPEVIFPVPTEKALPQIVSVVFPKHQGAVLVRLLSAQGVMTGAGSACQAESRTPSAVLTAMGIPQTAAFGLLRLSFDATANETQAQRFVESLKNVLNHY